MSCQIQPMERCDWVEIIEPKCREIMYVNLSTGDCQWDQPPNVTIKRVDTSQWWELFDTKTNRYYYYNPDSQQTIWQKPQSGDIIPLAKLQLMRQNTEVGMNDMNARRTNPLQTSIPRHKSAFRVVSPQRNHGTLPCQVQMQPTHLLQRLSYAMPHRQVSHYNNTSHPQQQYSALPSTPTSSIPRSQYQSPQSTYQRHQQGLQDPMTSSSTQHTPLTVSAVKARQPVRRSKSMKVTRPTNRSSYGSDLHGTYFCPIRHVELRQSLEAPASYDYAEFGKRSSSQYRRSSVYGVRQAEEPLYANLSPVNGEPAAAQSLFRHNTIVGDRRRLVNSRRSVDEQAMRRPVGETSNEPIIVASEVLVQNSCPKPTPVLKEEHWLSNGHCSNEVSTTSYQNVCLEDLSDESQPRLPFEETEIKDMDETEFKRSNGSPAPWTPTNFRGNCTAPPTSSAPPPPCPTAPNPGAPARATLPHCRPHLNDPNQVRRYFEEQCTVSEASMDSGLPADNSSWDSLDGGGPMPIGVNFGQFPGGSDQQPNERPCALSMGMSGLRGTPQTRRTAFPRTNPTCRRPSDPRPPSSGQHYASQRGSSIQRQSGGSGGTAGASNSSNTTTPCSSINGSSGLIVPPSSTTSSQYAAPSEHPPLPPTSSSQQTSSDGTTSVSMASSRVSCASPAPHSNNNSTAVYESSSGSIAGMQAHSSGASSLTEVGGPVTSPGGQVGPSIYQGMPVLVSSSANDGSSGHGYYQAYMPPPPEHLEFTASMPSPCSPGGTHGGMMPMVGNIQRHQSLLQPTYYPPPPGWNFAIFRKDTSPTKLLSWTKESLAKPMLIMTDKSLKKEAGDSFKQIQMYMGDRKAKHKPGELMNLILDRGKKYPQLRDEIYVQLCRQTTKNPDELSTSRGWELLCACLDCFPPSPTLHPFLEGYFLRMLTPPTSGEQPASPMVTNFALVAVQRIRQQPPEGHVGAQHLQDAQRAVAHLNQGSPNPHSRQAVDNSKKMVYHPGMFNSLLTDVMSLQKDRFQDRRLPWILVALTEEILKRNGTKTAKIFEINCTPELVTPYRLCCCENWDTTAQSLPPISPLLIRSPHLPATLLQHWLLELPDPVIPHQMRSLCLEGSSRTQEVSNILEQMPSLNRLCLLYIIRFLQRFAVDDVIACTQMDPTRLAQVFATPLFHSELSAPGSPNPAFQQQVQEVFNGQALFLRTLILHLDTTSIEGMR